MKQLPEQILAVGLAIAMIPMVAVMMLYYFLRDWVFPGKSSFHGCKDQSEETVSVMCQAMAFFVKMAACLAVGFCILWAALWIAGHFIK